MYEIRYYEPNSDEYIDLADDTISVDYSVGRKRFDVLGQVVQPGECLLTLDNSRQQYNPYNDNARISPLPGGIIDIFDGGERMYRFFTTGALPTYTPRNIRRTATLTAQGPLGRLQEFHRRVRGTFPARIRSGAAFERALDLVGWLNYRAAEGYTDLNGGFIARSGLLGNYKQQGDIGALLFAIVQAEGGLVLEADDGHIIFEDRGTRPLKYSGLTPVQASALPHFGPDGDVKIRLAEQSSVRDAILNILVSRKDTYTAQPNQVIYTKSDLAYANVLLPGQASYPNVEVFLQEASRNINDRWQFVNPYMYPELDVDYTFTGNPRNLRFTLLPHGSGLVINVAYNGDSPETLVFLQIRGNPYIVDGRSRLEEIRPESTMIYGDKERLYPIDLVLDPEEVRNHLSYMSYVHDGIALDGMSPELLRYVTVTCQLRNEQQRQLGRRIRVSDIVNVDIPGLNVSRFMFVEWMRHRIRYGEIPTVELFLSDYRQTAPFLIGNSQWGSDRIFF